MTCRIIDKTQKDRGVTIIGDLSEVYQMFKMVVFYPAAKYLPDAEEREARLMAGIPFSKEELENRIKAGLAEQRFTENCYSFFTSTFQEEP